MLARVRSAAVLGIDAFPVEVEVDISSGMPSFSTVGLPQGAVKEGRERVSAALANAGFQFPLRRITVNLAPADIRKDGSALDLPIALGLLVASGQLPEANLKHTMILGEVGLEGDLRPPLRRPPVRSRPRQSERPHVRPGSGCCGLRGRPGPGGRQAGARGGR